MLGAKEGINHPDTIKLDRINYYAWLVDLIELVDLIDKIDEVMDTDDPQELDRLIAELKGKDENGL
ncbi:MAG: hypothetical protein M3247_08915 [Thermoproteota archaeon]|nr:hypothetical protein [Thermoproteota archaeon]